MLNSLAKRGQHGSVESCIVLEKGPTCSLVAKAPQHLSPALREYRTARGEHCGRDYDWCVQTLVPNVVAPEAHQNDCSYVHALSSNTKCESICENFAWLHR